MTESGHFLDLFVLKTINVKASGDIVSENERETQRKREGNEMKQLEKMFYCDTYRKSCSPCSG